MPKFRKKPVVIEAVQFTEENARAVYAFLGFGGDLSRFDPKGPITVSTPSGAVNATSGDWIIKGVKGEFYPCLPDIFEQTYEQVEEGDHA